MVLKSTQKKTLSSYLAVISISFVCILLSINCNAYAEYSYSIDQFEVVGNLPGYFIDEFNDDILGPAWDVYQPTVTEAGEVVTLSSTGVPFSATIGGIPLSIESSTFESVHSGPTGVQDGAGNFTGTSMWLPDLPEMNQWFSMAIHHDPGSDLVEEISIGVANMDSTIASAFGLSSGGIEISFGRMISDESSGDFDVTFDFQSVLIDPDDVKENILLQLAFDDTSNQITGNFSLDGGATEFQSPFTSISPNTEDPSYIWTMGATSLSVAPEPVSSTLFLAGAATLGFKRFRKKHKKT
jgi:hypothetical protein